ncbi:MAG: cache domain-containing protein, partial [Oscillospiraceae bacterium]|nr:cache domain-containing protein [Oscillospiraceae bacterium]
MINPIQKLLNTKFRNKLVFMCITAVVPVTLAGVFLLYNLADTIRVNAVNESISTANSLKTRLNDVILTISNVSERVIQSDNIKELLDNNFINQDEYYNYYIQNQVIPEFLDAYPQVENITFYIDMEDFISNANFKSANETVSNTYWYREAMESGAARWQVIHLNDEYRLCRISPLSNSNGELCGAMVASVNPDVYKELSNDADYSVVFSVSQGVVFYSGIPDVAEGSVIASDESFNYGISDSKLLDDETNKLDRLGHTVVSYFDYDNTGNLFQIYVIKPYSLFNDEINKVIY